MKQLSLLIAALTLLITVGCDGSFDQRQEQADTANPGAKAIGSIANPNQSSFVRGTVSIGGSVREAFITLRPVNNDGSIDFDNANVLGSGPSFSNGIYQVEVVDNDYRGPIVVEVRGGTGASGANPATSLSNRFHDMRGEHVLYSVLPMYEGYDATQVDVTPLTTVAVARCLSFNGSIAGVTGGIAAGQFGLMCQQAAEFFVLSRIRARVPVDFAASGHFGNYERYGFVMAALSQLAKDAGVANVFDFYLGMYQDALDDGELNGSIGPVPNTGISMPDLGSGGLIGSALLNNYLDPNNAERSVNDDSNDVVAGNDLSNLINSLDSVRDIDNAVRSYELIVRVPGGVELDQGEEAQTRILCLKRVNQHSIEFHPFGDAAGPSFVDFAFTSSSPANVAVLPFGRISIPASASQGNYTVTVTIQPKAGQTFITGPTEVHVIDVKVK